MVMTYKLLPHLPAPPEEITNSINFSTVNPENQDAFPYRRRQLTNWNGRDFEAAMNSRLRLGNHFDQWVRENLVKEFNDACVNYVDGSLEKSSTGAHCDFTRSYVLIYNIKTGGPNATLCFWQEKGQPLEREPGLQRTDLSQLDLADSIVGPNDCWYIINANVLHGVENLSESRINLQVSLNGNPWQ